MEGGEATGMMESASITQEKTASREARLGAALFRKQKCLALNMNIVGHHSHGAATNNVLRTFKADTSRRVCVWWVFQPQQQRPQSQRNVRPCET
eukprot:7273959-Pyramimonas_sp.AAC.2